MTEPSMTLSRAELDAQAWRWVVRMDAEDWTSAEEAELQIWLAADPKRLGALLEAEAMWMALDGADAVVESGEAPVPPPNSRGPWFSRRTMLAGGGAALAASFAGGLLLVRGREVYATGVGEIRRVPLADGSTAAINTASRIDIELADTRRSVRLEQGEAWFQVAKDSNRPFVVEAGRIRAQAVGTAFAVRRHNNGADILVTEGMVEAWAEGADGNRTRLTAGQRAFVADNAAITSAPAELASVDRTLAWRSGRVDFVNDPIAEAAAEFNRYNRRKLVILDPAIGKERFDGVFRTDDPGGFAVAVRDSLSVPIDLSRSEEIRIGKP
ncbi:FecR family protein [Sphingosinicella rhizophila]|uniref:FecR domain-containing protein n=1 Tax=Sphingosinicella rhizophila TaxID=3050082 RepID=A0ABU3Q1T7_9SPHN|nr:FecR domain-containing protein [Sphingosinicella sp. GR2756]MDT9597376.1 FecR domain-containing protein [Sphingosinicella sp. GR2756]